MTTAEYRNLETCALAWIREARQPVSTTELLDQHREDVSMLSGEMLRRAIWNLVDRGLVEYDLSWRLRPAAER